MKKNVCFSFWYLFLLVQRYLQTDLKLTEAPVETRLYFFVIGVGCVEC